MLVKYDWQASEFVQALRTSHALKDCLHSLAPVNLSVHLGSLSSGKLRFGPRLLTFHLCHLICTDTWHWQVWQWPKFVIMIRDYESHQVRDSEVDW